jgi:alpha-ketoglutarate-dependent taurine dioxygenase
MTITVQNLTSTDFAAKVTGFTLEDVTLEGVQRRLQHLWLKHQVLVFEGLDYENEPRLAGLSKVFGRLEVHSRIEYNSPTVPELLFVSNIKEGERKLGVLGDGEADWHTDQTYRPTPALGSLLTAAVVPPEGGHTWFADMYRAYDALPDSLKERLEGLKAIQSYEHFNNRYSEPANRKQVSEGTVQQHPVIRVHPITGRKALYAAHPHFAALDRLDPADASGLGALADLGGKAEKTGFVSTVADFYQTNPIARASAVMAECSALASGRLQQAAE